MTTWAKHTIARAISDKRGTTALEYAMIGSAVAAVIVGCFKALFDPVGGVLARVTLQ